MGIIKAERNKGPVALFLSFMLLYPASFAFGGFFEDFAFTARQGGLETAKKRNNIIKSENRANTEERKQSEMKNKAPVLNLKLEKYFLENGMTVLLHQDSRVPQVYHQLLVKVGSRDEKKGKTGLAHLFEHLMFRGTDRYTGEEYDKTLERLGAGNNAFTTRDYTAYEVTVPMNKLKTVIEMEAERLNSLRLTQDNFDKEREVVKEERRQMTDNNPNETFEPVMNLVFKSHPYGRPVIGYMTDLSAMTLEDCKKFYSVYYAPDNSILILTGNFDLNKTKKWIQKYYGALKPSGIQKKAPLQEEKRLPPLKQRSVRLKRAVQAPTLVFAYEGPKAGEEGAYSLEVLSRVLSSGESSRLQRLLVYRHKLALSVSGAYYSLQTSGVFLLFVRMAPGGSLKKAKQLLLAEVNKTRSGEVSKKELLKSVRSIMNEYVSAMKSLEGKANALSLNEAYFGDYRELFKDLGRYEKVSAQSIKAQANLHLSPGKLFTVELLPEK